MTDLLEPIIASPRAWQYLHRLEQIHADEARARERFVDDLNDDVKAEFIQGVVVVHSPAKSCHVDASVNLVMLMSAFVKARGLGRVTSEKALVRFSRNDYEPDVCFYSAASAATISPDALLFPVPDMIVEVLSDSTSGRDRGVKFEDYAAHGVGEYWVADPEHQTVEQYTLVDGEYALRLKSHEGHIESTVIAGFRIPIRAIFDDAASLGALREIME